MAFPVRGTNAGPSGMNTVYMDTSTLRHGHGLKVWERALCESPEVQRKATVAQLCEYPTLHRSTQPQSTCSRLHPRAA